MRFEDMFRLLLAVKAQEMSQTEAQHLSGIIEGLGARNIIPTQAASLDEALQIVIATPAVGCMLVEWAINQAIDDIECFIERVRARGLEMPIFLLLRPHQLQTIQAKNLRHITGYVVAGKDQPDLIAQNLAEHLGSYANHLKTPFFGAMVDYAEQDNQLWTCPGHNGGRFYRKSPIGQVFVEHLGDAIFKNDFDNSVIELGDLLVHKGPARQAEIEAADIFGAERTYFILNGTSTSNKIALSAIIAPGDLVLFDRNNHKAAIHGALIFGGGIPVHLPTTRNAQGLIGPIDWQALDETVIRTAIRTHPLVVDKSLADKPRPFRACLIEQCTYDGTIYNVEMIMKKLAPLCEYMFFDEAWAGFLKFHPLFKGHYAMGIEPQPGDPGIIATQSTHKQLAGFSQASQIHVKDSHVKGKARVEPRRFNELYMLHYSTSPFYPLFASLDVGAQMMKGRSGEVLWDETIQLGIEIRKKIRALGQKFVNQAKTHRDSWFFDPFVPDTFNNKPWEETPTAELAHTPNAWALAPNAQWHGFPGLAENYAMTDPNKLTLLTPGFDRQTGDYMEHGVPAPVLAVFLRERHVVAEKNDFNSILFLLTPGIEDSKVATLLAALTAFKEMHDANTKLDIAVPIFAKRYAARYAGMGLRDLCQELHNFYRTYNASAQQRALFKAEYFPEQVVAPRAAWEKLIHNQVEYLPLSALAGRISATVALVYPPGIGLILPGERYGDKDSPLLCYLRLVEEGYNRFPGFEAETQGIYQETDTDGKIHLYSYVLAEYSL